MAQQNSFELSSSILNLAEASNAQIEALVRGAKPKDPFGFAVRGTTAEIDALDVANNPHLRNAIAYDETTLGFKQYNTGTGLWDAVAIGQITTASQIADAVITLAKLNSTGAAAKYILRRNAANTAFEWVPATSIYDTGSIPLAALEGGTEGSMPRVVGGLKIWDSFANITNAVLAAITSFDIQKLSGKIASAILSTDASGNSTWQQVATFFSSIANNSIPAAKIDGAGTSGQVLTTDGVNSSYQTPAVLKTITVPKATTLDAAAGLAGGLVFTSVELYQALGNRIPKFYRLVAVCTVDDVSSTVIDAGDEIDVVGIVDNSDNAISNSWWDSSTNELKFTFSNGATYKIWKGDGVGPATIALTRTSYTLKLYAYA